MDKTTKILMALAAASTVAFLYKSSKDQGLAGLNNFEGVNVTIEPDKLLEHARKHLTRLNPQHRDMLINAAQGIVRGYLGEMNRREES
jgi:hypothetical protein